MPKADWGNFATSHLFTRICNCIYNLVMSMWDEAKRRKNLADHGIDFADLDDFFDGDLLTREDSREAYGERRYQSVGMLHAVLLFVVRTPAGAAGEKPHFISARKADRHERKAWSQRYRKR